MDNKDFNIKGFIRTSLVDWPGKISSVLFLGGCGFRCPACHNHRLVLDPASIPNYPIQDVSAHLEKRRNWIDGVTVSGGEPTMRKDLPDLLQRLDSCGVRIKLDTNGSNPAMVRQLVAMRLLTAVYMDVKAPLTNEHYSRVAGVAVDVRVIRRSIAILKESGLDVVFRTTVVPGLVEEPELESIVSSLGDIARYIVQPFRNLDTLDPSLAHLKEIPPDRLERMRARFEIPFTKDAGLTRLACTG